MPKKQDFQYSKRGLILLDRDGVLNSAVIDKEHGTIDSPLHPDQVSVFEWVPDALLKLNKLGYGLCIVTNQPSAAKHKTTIENLNAVHDKVLSEIQSKGAIILSSHICFHKSEDHCSCRKPKPGLLKDAIDKNHGYDLKISWMVGDGLTDIQAGKTAGLKTAFLGPKKCDACKIFDQAGTIPDFWCDNLDLFSHFIADQDKGEKS
ncbi:MAG: HAD-IIIA family hydrolase [Candidatus Poribacteria bacterium]